MRQSQIFSIFIFSFFLLFIAPFFNSTKIQAENSLCFYAFEDSGYAECSDLDTKIDCADEIIEGTSGDGCFPGKWECSGICPSNCNMAFVNCGGTSCSSKYEACGCTCVGGIQDNNITTGCVGAPGDSNNDGNPCDPGETMFNCTPDCLPAGVPVKKFDDVLDDLIGWILGIGLLLSVLYLVWGGIYYVTSSGDSQKTENARKIIKYALLGVLVIGLSYAAVIMLDKIFV